MFKKIKKLAKKDLVNKNKELTKEVFTKTIKNNGKLLNGVKQGSAIRIHSSLTDSLNDLSSSGRTVRKSLEKGHAVAIDYLVNDAHTKGLTRSRSIKSTNDKGYTIYLPGIDTSQEVLDRAYKIGYNMAMWELLKKERMINRLRGLAVAGGIAATAIAIFK